MPPRPGIARPLKLGLPWNNYSGRAAHWSEVGPKLSGDSAVEHQVSDLFCPRTRTQPIFMSVAKRTLSRVLHNLANIKFVATQRRSLFSVTCETSGASQRFTIGISQHVAYPKGQGHLQVCQALGQDGHDQRVPRRLQLEAACVQQEPK